MFKKYSINPNSLQSPNLSYQELESNNTVNAYSPSIAINGVCNHYSSGKTLNKLREELKLSAIPDDWGEHNFCLASGRTLAEILYQGVKWDRGKHLKSFTAIADSDGGWYAQGDGDIFQVKLFDSRTSWQGKKIKYESPRGVETGFFRCNVPGDPTYWDRFLKDKSIPICVLEGAKKTASVHCLGYASIGSPGIWNFYGKDGKLKPEVAKYLKGRTVRIIFDQDEKPKTREAVKSAISKLAKLLHGEYGCTVVVIEWDLRLGKGIDDVHYNHGPEVVRNLIENGTKWTPKKFSCPATPPTLTRVDERISSRFMPAIKDIHKLLAIKSGLGTGKTHAIAELAKEYDQVFVVTSRRSLGRSLSERFGIPYRDEIVNGESLEGMINGVVLCLPSMHPKSLLKWESERVVYTGSKTLLVLDEIESLMSELLFSGTCSDYRSDIMNEFLSLIHLVDKIVISDGNLSMPIVEQFESIVGEKAYIIENTYQDVTTTYDYALCSNPEEIINHFINEIKEGGIPFITTGSQAVESQHSPQNLKKIIEAKLAELGITGYDIIDVDRETVSEPGHKAQDFFSDINGAIRQWKQEGRKVIVICSPVVEMGLSIDEKYFTSQFDISNGLHSPFAISQRLLRVRDTSIPRYIHDPKSANNYLFGGGITPQEIANYMATAKKADELLWSKAIAIAGYQELYNSFDNDDKEGGDRLNKYNAVKEFQKLACLMSAEHNKGQKCQRESLRLLLKSQGHREVDLTECPDLSSDELKEAKAFTREVRDVRTIEYYERVTEAEDVKNDEELDCLNAKRQKTPDERLSIAKAMTKKKYGKVSKDILSADKKGLNDAVFYHLWRKFPETFNDRCLMIGKKLDITDSNKRERTFKMLSGLFELIENDTEIRNDDQFQIKLNELAIEKREHIRIGTGINIGEKNTPARTISTLLHPLGYQLKFDRQIRVNGERVRVYKIVSRFKGIDLSAIIDHRMSNYKSPSLTPDDVRDGRDRFEAFGGIKSQLSPTSPTSPPSPPPHTVIRNGSDTITKIYSDKPAVYV